MRSCPSVPPEPILDSTFNRGRFRKGASRRVVSMDINPEFRPMIVGDNRVMEGAADEAFGCVVHDPPHAGPQGRDKSWKRFDEDFGAAVACGKEQGWKLGYLYPSFIERANARRQASGRSSPRTGKMTPTASTSPAISTTPEPGRPSEIPAADRSA